MLTSLPPLLVLFFAIVLEVFATSWLPKTQQFTALLPTAGVLLGYALSFYLVSIAIQNMPVGVAYAIWSGVGVVLVALISWLVYGQKIDGFAVLGIALILSGTLVINLFSSSVNH